MTDAFSRVQTHVNAPITGVTKAGGPSMSTQYPIADEITVRDALAGTTGEPVVATAADLDAIATALRRRRDRDHHDRLTETVSSAFTTYPRGDVPHRPVGDIPDLIT